MAEPILSVRAVAKIYPDGTIANHDVSFDVMSQTVHAIVGENGAGKTTLMKILFGMETSQGGEIQFMGELHHPSSPHEAIRRRVGMVHQHLMLAPDLTVAENLILGIEPLHKRLFLDRKKISRVAREVSERYGLPVPPDALIRELPVGIRQRVEILKALYRDATLLILDEPTAVLTPQESEGLFQTLDTLKAEGKTILFISHKLDEVTRVADRVTIMRAGTVVETTVADTLDKATIAHRMVGREIDFRRVAVPKRIGEVLLTAEGLGYSDKDGVPVVKDVSLKVRSGEILGVAGVEGNGQTEIVRILTGLLEPDRGSVNVRNVALSGLPPRKVRESGVGHIPEDRMEDGAATEASIRENFIVDRYYHEPFSRFGRIVSRETSALSRKLIKDYEIHCRNEQQPIGSLSGGNIQKCVVARELSADPDVIVASQPTRGVDIGSWERIHELLVDARDRGKGVFLVSADLDELLKLATRIVVIYNGRIVARFDDTAELTPEELGPYMLGVDQKEVIRG
jgi:general nucleoside transport system ATP-binding protein